MAEKRPYESPRIARLETAAAALTGKNPVLEVLPATAFEEPYDIRRLLTAYGSPLFLVSEKALRARYRSFRDTFTAPDIDTRIAYSYKTNYLPALCAILHEEGAEAEVVSGMEYQLARALGVPGERIVFNGPLKRREELEAAVGEGALVNIDGFEEIAAIDAVARALGRVARVGIRVNFRYGNASWTKFGFSHDSGESRQALEQVAARPHLRLEALHNHSGTFQVDAKVYDRATAVLIDLARRARALGLAPTTLDLGGGFPSSNKLKPMFDVPGGSQHHGRHLTPFAEAILHRLSRAKDLFGGRPVLLVEPGRAVVDSAVWLACRVVAKKAIAGHGDAVVVDAGINVLPTAFWYDHGVDVARDGENIRANDMRRVTIYGPLCMQIDVVREGAFLPPLEIGDALLVSNVGAYCQTQSMQFIHPRPAAVLLGPGGPDVVRRRETWRNVFALDQVPERLHQLDHTL